MHRICRITSSLLLGVIFLAGSAGATAWQMSADSSRLEFLITYSGQEALGVFRRFATELQLDPAALADSRLIVTVAVLSADMDSADINEAIAGPEWFDFTGYAEAQFISESIVKIDGTGNQFVAHGRLRLKGVERVIDVPFTWSQTGQSAHMRGELMLQRGDFGIGSGEWATSDIIGQAVRVRFDIALQADIDR